MAPQQLSFREVAPQQETGKLTNPALAGAQAGEAHVTTLFISHPSALLHDMGPGHPERPDRMRVIERALESETFQMLARERAQRASGFS